MHNPTPFKVYTHEETAAGPIKWVMVGQTAYAGDAVALALLYGRESRIEYSGRTVWKGNDPDTFTASTDSYDAGADIIQAVIDQHHLARCPSCDAPAPYHAPGCEEDPAFSLATDREIDRRLGK